MKKFWMGGVLLLIASMFALLAATGAGPARADLGTAHAAPTCGTSDSTSDAKAVDFWHNGPPTNWTVDVKWDCGQGKTFMWEIQGCLSNCGAGSNYSGYSDYSSHHWITSSGCPVGLCEVNFHDTSFGCSSLRYYRVKVYDAGGREYFYPDQAGEAGPILDNNCV